MWSLIFIACPKIDQQAWRTEQKEQLVVMENAQLFWQGIRWEEPTRSMLFIEDPLLRSRFEASIGEKEFVEVKVLQAELQPDLGERGLDQVWRKATVLIYVEEIENGYSVQKKEIEQEWYRKANGWYVDWSATN